LTELFAAWKAALADELAPSDWHLNRAHARLRRIVNAFESCEMIDVSERVIAP
jgi:hypothetical protein